MLNIGLTGGIASGKSVVARRLAELGAVLIDADVLAREVVEPGTVGLAHITEAFGPAALTSEGALDRPALARIVFDQEQHRERLNAIVHPLVRAEAARQLDSAGPEAVVVQDIPLLVETGREAEFHLVVVVEAPQETRIERMMADRGMARQDALARIRAQADDDERQAAADVVLHNDTSVTALTAAVDRLWHERLLPFNENLLAGRAAARSGPAMLATPRPEWAQEGRLLAARLARADQRIARVDHIGSTAVPELPAKDVIDLQVTVASLSDADELAAALTAAGFPKLPGQWRDTPKAAEPDPARWEKRLHANADPARPVNVHIRAAGSPGWRYALAFRDWLRADQAARRAYLEAKRQAAQACADDTDIEGYAQRKEAWICQHADRELAQWIDETGWDASRP